MCELKYWILTSSKTRKACLIEGKLSVTLEKRNFQMSSVVGCASASRIGLNLQQMEMKSLSSTFF